MIDGSLVESALDDSSSIILRQVGEGEGSAGISLSIENADKILQFAKKKFTMFLELVEVLKRCLHFNFL